MLLLDHDLDGTPIDTVALHSEDAPYRLRLIDRAMAALEMARKALSEAHHDERWEFHSFSTS